MSDGLKKGQNRRKRIVYFIMGSFLVWVAYTWNGQEEILQSKQNELETLNKQLVELKEKNEELNYTVQRLYDPDYIANLARNNYYFSQDGEIIFEIITQQETNEER